MAGLTPTQIRLKTGGFKNKQGKIIGGMVLPKDVSKDVRAGNVEIVSVKNGIAVRATSKGRKVIAQRMKRKGFL